MTAFPNLFQLAPPTCAMFAPILRPRAVAVRTGAEAPLVYPVPETELRRVAEGRAP